MANCVYSKLQEFGLLEKVEALVFDTTGSNTGRWNGIITRALFWLACRHHIPELFIKHANIAVRGPKKGPEDSLFKDIKEQFHFINLEDKMLWK